MVIAFSKDCESNLGSAFLVWGVGNLIYRTHESLQFRAQCSPKNGLLLRPMIKTLNSQLQAHLMLVLAPRFRLTAIPHQPTTLYSHEALHPLSNKHSIRQSAWAEGKSP